MIVAPIRNDQLLPLRDLLAEMNQFAGHADPYNSLLPFAQFKQLHVARFTILELNTIADIKEFGVTPRPWHPQLAFIGDFDGDRLEFFTELIKQAGEGLSKIFSHCEEYDQQTDLMQWMKSHNIEPAANYINWIGRTVKQIHEEENLHKCLANYLQQIVDKNDRENPRALRQQLLSHIEFEKHADRLVLTPAQPSSLQWKIKNYLHMLSIPLLLIALTPVAVIFAPFYLIRLRMLERSDPELFIRPSREHIKRLSIQEDHYISNQFNVLGDVKPGKFRLLTFKFILFLLSYLTRHIFNRGFLARIKTIHFARWVFLDNDQRIFFASNYDGSHESYMDDFINKVGWGLNLSFSNSVGYPNTNWLINQGAAREQPFKYTQRRHQLPSEVWYKAYPDLTATDLARNSRIRRGVEIRQSSDAEIRKWLSLI